MSEIENQLPADIDTLHALMVAACAERDAAIAERETAIGERDRALSQIDRLRHLLRQLQRAHFGKRSEKLDPDQLLLTLEDIEQAIAESEAHDDKKDAIAAKVRAEKRRANRGALPRHLPRVDVTIAPEDTNCPCCRTPMHVIGEETSERLDVIPAQFRVIVTHRPKYACRACEEAPVQAPAPERLIKGGLPTEAMVAYVLAAKYAWHLPLYRQAQILLSQGVAIERATLAFWVGYAAAELKPLYLRLRELILVSLKIAVDETVAPVLDPGRGRTKKGYFWAIARDDRPWGGTDPPAIAYTYAPGRGAVHALKLLDTYHGIVQCDGYAAYKNIANAAYLGEAITLAFCWAHLRRKFFEIAKGGSAPIASEALDRIALLYAIEKTIRGRSADERRACARKELDLQALHRVRSRLVSERTAVINQIRGFLLERSIIVRQGLRFLRQLLPDILAKRTDVLSPRIVRIVIDLAGDWRQLDERIETVTDEIETLAKSEDSCRRVMTVPGIGPIISSAMVAAIGSGVAFAKGRDFSAWLGLVPKQMSTGDRTILGRISKRGNGYLRMLFMQAARVILLRPANWPKHGFGVWLVRAAQRLHPNVLAAALANKLARIAWTVLVQERSYQARVTKAAA